MAEKPSAQRFLPGLQTNALVHEVYLRLVDVTKVEWQQRAQFYAMAAQEVVPLSDWPV